MVMIVIDGTSDDFYERVAQFLALPIEVVEQLELRTIAALALQKTASAHLLVIDTTGEDVSERVA